MSYRITGTIAIAGKDPDGTVLTIEQLNEIHDRFHSSYSALFGITTTRSTNSTTLSEDDLSHMVTDLYLSQDDLTLSCTVELLDTMSGRIVKSLMDRGMKWHPVLLLTGARNPDGTFDDIGDIQIHLQQDRTTLTNTVSDPISTIN